jgi:pimeloyl-ACP methyl ester carboxylesterase
MLVFAHGLEGSPEGKKVRAMRAAGLEVHAPDFRQLVLAERVDLLTQRTSAGGVLLCGSSYGGVASALVAARHPERFRGLVLLAPALLNAEPPNDPDTLAAPAIPTVIVHGTRDTVCELDGSRAYQRRSGDHVRLIEVDDGHRLEGSLDLIVRELQALSATFSA